MEFTKEQEQAVRLRHHDILVSAGAGAGKTRVLVNRMAEMILDRENPVDADEFLVMTFTNAAAAEMKERITAELNARLEKEESRHRLHRQIRMMKHADISTVHSFCNHLIRMHFNEAGIDPSFRIGEEGELFLLRQKAMEDLLEEAYGSERESFVRLVEAYAPGKDDRAVETLIEELYHFSRGFPDGQRWFSHMMKETEKLENPETIEESAVIQNMLAKTRRICRENLSRIEEALTLFGDVPEPERFYHLLEQDRDIIARIQQEDTFNGCGKAMAKADFSDLPRAAKKEKEWPYLEEIKNLHKQVREEIQSLYSSFFLSGKEKLCEENQKLRPFLKELIFLAGRYEEIYFQYKKEKNVYDFDDLEHIALSILVESYDEEGNPVPSETAKQLSRKYKAIFVDEYQDTNLVQETIVNALCREGENHLFAVGDVKQSIYRFRQARPDLFLYRHEMYRQKEGAADIELRDNFRSAPGVLSFCNTVFCRLMDKQFGGVDYTEEVALRPGENGPMADCTETSECMLLVDDEEKENLGTKINTVQGETAMIAGKIKRLKEEGYAYKDMVILLRSGAGTAEQMAEGLRTAGISAVCESHTGYFQSREVQVILNYLAVVDNVYQEIPMASVLLSSIGKLTEKELASLRTLTAVNVRKEYSLYTLMEIYLREGKDETLRHKLRHFLEQLQYFRKRKKEMPLHELLWEIYTKTGIIDDIRLMPEGEERKENLLMLLKKAEDYEKTVFKGLFYFLRYMEQLRTYEIEIGGGSLQEESADTVRIMTIHKSKGLEFPVVFVSGLAKRFNLMDGNRPVLFHPETGIGMEYVDLDKRIHHPSLLKKAIREQMLKETLEEELRILYVAMTRAQKKLILTGVVKKEKLEEIKQEPLSFDRKMAARCFLDWLLPMMEKFTVKKVHFHELEEEFNVQEEKQQQITLEEIMDKEEMQIDISPADASFSYVYPYRESAGRKRKYSVSELKKLSMISLEGEESAADYSQKDLEEELPKPAFLQENQAKISSAEKGTIIHKIMELLPFGKIRNKKELFDALENIKNIYSPVKEISMAEVYKGTENFLFSEFGEKISAMDRKGKIYKELPFTVGLPESMICGNETSSQELVVVQGIIDLCCEEEDGLLLFDYKTDYIKEGEEGLLLDRYKSQMVYYKTALEQIFHKKVKHSYIYSFALKQFYEIFGQEK